MYKIPELPEVQAFKTYLDATSLHQQITEVNIREPRLIHGIRPDHLKKTLVGDAFDSADRHGKYLLIQLLQGNWLVLHFGMTGDLVYFKSTSKEPDYAQVLFAFDNGYHLAYQSSRKLGEIQLVNSKQVLIEQKDLGPDALATDFDFQAFQQVLAGRRGLVKTTLMNQSILAGIGNIYSDEILFQAGLHPRTPMDSLDGPELYKLYKTMNEVLQTITNCLIHHQALPDTYLVHHRDPSEKCPRCGGNVKRIKIGGRHAYYCPCRQREQPQRAENRG